MNFDGYPMQVLIAIARGCRPNSPIEGRAWVVIKYEDRRNIPDHKEAMSALLKAGLVERAKSQFLWRVRPTPLGYDLVKRWREHRAQLRVRPVLYAKVKRELGTIHDQRHIWPA